MAEFLKFSAIFLLLTFLRVIGENGIEGKPSPDIRLRRVKTEDEFGETWERIVTVDSKKEGNSSGDSNKTVSRADSEDRPVDDEAQEGEEEKPVGSGDSTRENKDGEYDEHDFNVANDPPMKPGNESLPTLAAEVTGKPFKSAVNTSTSTSSTENPVTVSSTTQKSINSSADSAAPIAVTTVAASAPSSTPKTTLSTGVTTAATTSTPATSITSQVNTSRQQSSTKAKSLTERTVKSHVTTSVPARVTSTVSSPKTTAIPTSTEVLRITTDENSTADTKHVSTDHGSNSTGKEIIATATTILPVQSPTTTGPNTGVVYRQKAPNVLFGFVTLEILIALLAGALFSVLLVAFLVYRLKKRNEGSYELSETIALRPKELDEMGTKKEVFV